MGSLYKKGGVDKSIVVLLMSGVVVMSVVIGYEIYRAYRRVEVPEGLERLLVPLDPSLKGEVFGKLEGRTP